MDSPRQRRRYSDRDDLNDSSGSFRSESNKSLSRRDSTDQMDTKRTNSDENLEYENQTKVLSSLMKKRSESDYFSPPKMGQYLEKDPDITDTVEDFHATLKLKKEREEKKALRERQSKNKTGTTQRTEEAIETIENALNDNIRLSHLKEMQNQLLYSTKPQVQEQSVVRRPQSADRAMKKSTKYANVQSKIKTQLLDTSLTSELNQSRDDNNKSLNDSIMLRQSTYNEWLMKKSQIIREKSSQAKLAQKNQEEEKTQQLINTLQKSKEAFKIWSAEKEKKLKADMIARSKSQENVKDEEQKKKEKIKDAELAFKEWLRRKTEQIKEKKEEELTGQLNNKRDERNKNDVPSMRKPPLPFDSWMKHKEAEEREKRKINSSSARKREEVESEKEKNRRQARQAFQEWLEKKSREEYLNQTRNSRENLNKTIDIPFYPSSKTIKS